MLPPFGRQAARQDPEQDEAHGAAYGAYAGMARGNARVRLARVDGLGGLVDKLVKAGFQVLYRRRCGRGYLARDGMARHIREIGQGRRECTEVGTALYEQAMLLAIKQADMGGEKLKLAFQAELKLTSLVETPDSLSFASWGGMEGGRWGMGYAKKG